MSVWLNTYMWLIKTILPSIINYGCSVILVLSKIYAAFVWIVCHLPYLPYILSVID